MKILCPICKEQLILKDKTYKCKNGHTYDQAKQGYLNLSSKQKKTSGDATAMGQARSAFLEAGYYDMLKQEIHHILKQRKPKTLLDIGCGEGYYTRSFCDKVDEVIGIDLSKSAIVYAAAKDKQGLYLVGSIYHLPFEEESFDMIVSIFTPLPLEEIQRVLKKEGVFVSVTPGVMHHYELKEVLYDTVRLNEEPLQTLEGFELMQQNEIKEKVHVKDPMTLLEMTPYRYRCSKEGLEKMEQKKKGGLNVTFDFVVSQWRKI